MFYDVTVGASGAGTTLISNLSEEKKYIPYTCPTLKHASPSMRLIRYISTVC